MNDNQNPQTKTVSEADFNTLKLADAINTKNICNLALMDSVFGPDYLPRQLAEECSELAQAALKLIRARNGETPDSITKARNLYIEEIADVWVMLSLALLDLSEDELQYCVDVSEYKSDRLNKRLCEAITQRRRKRRECMQTEQATPEQAPEADQTDAWDALDEAWAAMDDALADLEAEYLFRKGNEGGETV